MNDLKARFLEIVKEIKETGIAKRLQQTTSSEEFRAIWCYFAKTNKDITRKISLWNSSFKANGSKKLFASGEKLEDVEEVVIFIHFLSYKAEDNIFENKEDLRNALYKSDNIYGLILADLIEDICILDVTAKFIFENMPRTKRKKKSKIKKSGTNHS